MESAVTLFYQIVKMFIMMTPGYILYRNKTINDDTTSRLSSMLLMVTTPCMIASSFNQTYSTEKLIGLLVSFGLSLVIYLLNIVISNVMYPKHKSIEKFSLIFSNAGFLGIPLVTGLLGVEAVFYLAPFIALFYVFVWTYGIVLMSGDKKIASIKKVTTNPCVWSVGIGLVIFLMPVKPFTPVMEAVSTLGAMTTPLAMIILGAYMAKTNLLKLFTNLKVYQVSLYRLILCPVIVIFLFKFVPASYNEVRMVLLIAASAPVAVICPIFAQMFDKGTDYGSQIVCLSTILCLVSMPAMLIVASYLW